MTRPFPRSLPLLVLEAVLVAFLLIRGVIPAFTTISTDFPNYYTAARIVASGGAIDRLYDDRWFQEQIAAEGIPLQGKFSPFPPVTALLLVPLAVFGPLTALRILTVLNLAAIVGSIVLLTRATRISFHGATLIVLLSGIGLANCLRFGQVYILLAFFLLLGYYFYRGGRRIAAGVCFGVWIPIKYYPLVLLIYFLLNREWRILISAMVTACVVVAVSIALLGWDIHRQFLTSVLGGHLSGELSLQSPFSPVFQSFSSLYRSLFLEDQVLHPHALILSPLLYWLFTFGTLAVIASIAVRGIVQAMKAGDDGSIVLSLLALLPLLFAPATATYHGVLLWLPAGLLANRLSESEHPTPRYTLALLYAVLGFIPYSYFMRFYDRGFLILLAYPRLLVLTAAFAIIAYFARSIAAETPVPSLVSTRFQPEA